MSGSFAIRHQYLKTLSFSNLDRGAAGAALAYASLNVAGVWMAQEIIQQRPIVWAVVYASSSKGIHFLPQ